MYISYQDFQKAADKSSFIRFLIDWHKSRDIWRTAIDADRYDKQQNTTIMNFTRMYYTVLGAKKVDTVSSNNRIASNFFKRLNTQRCAYSLGNGITFNEEKSSKAFGNSFDTDVYKWGYKALIHGISFAFLNIDHIHVFPVTEFAPLFDEETGQLMAGVRFWSIDSDKPEFAVLYEIDGYTKYRSETIGGEFDAISEKKAYRYNIMKAPADEEPEVIVPENYSSLPIIPMYGNSNKQSTLVGMKSAIDSYDLIRSGFANDLQDCAEIYWIISNADGMDGEDLVKFRDRMRLNKVVQAEEGQVTPFRQEIPFQARETYLASIRSGIYEDFGGLDVHAVSAGATNDHIDAAYQPLDENADDFEYQVIQAVQGILSLLGIEDTPNFKRNRISNIKEQVEIIGMEANDLDQETRLKKYPNITSDEIPEILKKLDEENMERMGIMAAQQQIANGGGVPDEMKRKDTEQPEV